MPPKRNNHRGDGKDGGEMTKSGKKHRATTTVDAATVDATTVDANASCTETALPNATNLGAVFEAAANNAVPAPESNLVPDATSIDAARAVIMDEEHAGTTDVTAAITTTDEPHLESFFYDLPFTIFDRFVASDCPWAIDKQTLNAQQLFSASGERRRKEVKDDFEWLHPTTRPADIAAAREAYQSKYSLLHDGI